MGTETKIQWADHSASPWHGCAEVHAGCDNCYARTQAKRNPKTLGVWGPDGTRVRSASFWANCRRWNKAAEKAGVVASVFPSICDIFEDWQGPILDSKGHRFFRKPDGEITTIPHVHEKHAPTDGWITMDDLRRDLFALIDECQSLRFLLLTKRPQNVRQMWPGVSWCTTADFKVSYRPNVWLLTSISDQPTADAMIPPLLECRNLCPVLGVSAEPLLGEVDLEAFLPHPEGGSDGGDESIGWTIVGGESGHRARPCDLAWIRSIVQQCRAAGVPCFHKQLGSNPRDGELRFPSKDSKGGDMDEFPSDLRVRQFPEIAHA